jgi:hypothetical protein
MLTQTAEDVPSLDDIEMNLEIENREEFSCVVSCIRSSGDSS